MVDRPIWGLLSQRDWKAECPESKKLMPAEVRLQVKQVQSNTKSVKNVQKCKMSDEHWFTLPLFNQT